MSDLENYANLINQQTQLNNSWSAEQAQKQMDFQERMSSTAHQREVADLKAAGLNPVLSANSGATTPTGAMAAGTDANISAIANIAMSLADAENAKAIAAMRSAGSGSGEYYGKNEWSRMLQDIIEGYTGTSAKESLRNLGSAINRSGLVGSVLSAAKNVATKISGWFKPRSTGSSSSGGIIGKIRNLFK